MLCEWCLNWNFPESRCCRGTRCPGVNHHVKQQRFHEKSLRKVKYNLERGFPIAAHYARMLGLQCDDENFKSYGDEGKALATSIDPETIPGSEPFPDFPACSCTKM